MNSGALALAKADLPSLAETKSSYFQPQSRFCDDSGDKGIELTSKRLNYGL
jgi:hypothetical protein